MVCHCFAHALLTLLSGERPIRAFSRQASVKGCRSLIPVEAAMAAAGVGLGLVALPTPVHADTTLVRELAKNKARVVIIVSGPQADEQGRILQGALTRYPGNGHKADEILVVPIADAAKEATLRPKESAVSLVWLLATKEWNGAVPAGLESALPIRLSDVKEGDGVLRCEMTNPVNRGLAYTTVLAAPDGPRLGTLLQHFLNRSAFKAEGLAFSETNHTYKLAVFSAPEDKQYVESWGRQGTGAGSGWTEYRWFPLEERDKLTPPQLEEFHQAYFIDRSGNAPLPRAVEPLLAGKGIKDTTTYVAREDLGHRLSLALFSAPNNQILQAKANRYRTFDSISGGRVMEDVKDLRHIDRTTLLISGAGPSSEDREAIRLLVAKAMRDELHVNVEERGDVLKLLEKEVTLQELQGASGTAEMLRRKGRLRYVWLFHVLEYGGGTEYRTGERLLDEQKLVPYEQAHPDDREEPEPICPPFSGDGTKAKYKRLHDQWEPGHRAWLARKADYEDRERAHLTAQFERSISVTTTCRTRGILRLVDLKDQEAPVEVIWEKECRGSASRGPETYKQDTVTVRAGFHPNSLTPPNNSDTCPPDVLKQSAIDAAHNGIVILQETAWLPEAIAEIDHSDGDGHVAGPTDIDRAAKQGTPPIPMPPVNEPPPVSTLPAVAAITGNTVTLARRDAKDVRPGDRATIVTKTEDIQDPKTHEVLKSRAVETITLKVVAADEKTVDCVPVSAVEAAKLTQVHVGAEAKLWRPAPTSNVTAPTPKAAKHKRH